MAKQNFEPILDDLRKGLSTRDEELYSAACRKVEELDIPAEKCRDVLEPIMKDDPFGTTKWMDSVHRPQQVACVLHMGEGEEWESQVHYPPTLFQGALDMAWMVYPHVPTDNPWGDDVPKVNVEVVNHKGAVMHLTGLASRAEWIINDS
mmetsp:Transcript_39853/g.105674  ORF Transcript_39853/g.105674 Transcript_39853/m.105674 type:complete len:149 (-) Transcript_39853:160-606(-)